MTKSQTTMHTDAGSLPRFPRALSIMGTPVVPFESYAQAVDYIEQAVACRRKSFCVAINPEKVHRATRDPRLLAVLRQADVALCDGIGIALAARLLHGQKMARCTGCDLFFHLMARAGEKGWKVFLLGASPEANAEACSRLPERYRGLQIVGKRDGYFEDSAEVIRQINASGAELLFVAMGSPKQEFWIAEHRQAIEAPFCMGVGGTLDVASGKARRAPGIFRKTGTEFLFRLLADPKRWRRQAVLPVFLAEVLKSRVCPPQTWRA